MNPGKPGESSKAITSTSSTTAEDTQEQWDKWLQEQEALTKASISRAAEQIASEIQAHIQKSTDICRTAAEQLARASPEKTELKTQIDDLVEQLGLHTEAIDKIFDAEVTSELNRAKKNAEKLRGKFGALAETLSTEDRTLSGVARQISQALANQTTPPNNLQIPPIDGLLERQTIFQREYDQLRTEYEADLNADIDDAREEAILYKEAHLLKNTQVVWPYIKKGTNGHYSLHTSDAAHREANSFVLVNKNGKTFSEFQSNWIRESSTRQLSAEETLEFWRRHLKTQKESIERDHEKLQTLEAQKRELQSGNGEELLHRERVARLTEKVMHDFTAMKRKDSLLADDTTADTTLAKVKQRVESSLQNDIDTYLNIPLPAPSSDNNAKETAKDKSNRERLEGELKVARETLQAKVFAIAEQVTQEELGTSAKARQKSTLFSPELRRLKQQIENDISGIRSPYRALGLADRERLLAYETRKFQLIEEELVDLMAIQKLPIAIDEWKQCKNPDDEARLKAVVDQQLSDQHNQILQRHDDIKRMKDGGEKNQRALQLIGHLEDLHIVLTSHDLAPREDWQTITNALTQDLVEHSRRSEQHFQQAMDRGISYAALKRLDTPKIQIKQGQQAQLVSKLFDQNWGSNTKQRWYDAARPYEFETDETKKTLKEAKNWRGWLAKVSAEEVRGNFSELNWMINIVAPKIFDIDKNLLPKHQAAMDEKNKIFLHMSKNIQFEIDGLEERIARAHGTPAADRLQIQLLQNKQQLQNLEHRRWEIINAALPDLIALKDALVNYSAIAKEELKNNPRQREIGLHRKIATTDKGINALNSHIRSYLRSHDRIEAKYSLSSATFVAPSKEKTEGKSPVDKTFSATDMPQNNEESSKVAEKKRASGDATTSYEVRTQYVLPSTFTSHKGFKYKLGKIFGSNKNLTVSSNFIPDPITTPLSTPSLPASYIAGLDEAALNQIGGRKVVPAPDNEFRIPTGSIVHVANDDSVLIRARNTITKVETVVRMTRERLEAYQHIHGHTAQSLREQLHSGDKIRGFSLPAKWAVTGNLTPEDHQAINDEFNRHVEPAQIPPDKDVEIKGTPFHITSRDTVLYRQRDGEPQIYEVPFDKLKFAGRGDRADIEARIHRRQPVHFWIHAQLGHREFYQISKMHAAIHEEAMRGKPLAEADLQIKGELSSMDKSTIYHACKGNSVAPEEASRDTMTKIAGQAFGITARGTVLYRQNEEMIKSGSNEVIEVPIARVLASADPLKRGINGILDSIRLKRAISIDIPPITSAAIGSYNSKMTQASSSQQGRKSSSIK